VEEPDCQFLMDISSGSSYLLVPSFPADHALWCGQPLSPSDFKVKYGMTNCFTVNEWKRVLELHPQSKSILVLESTELKDHPLSSALSVETTRLKQALIEARVYKTPGEIELMRHAAEITRQAHVSLMKSIGKGEIQNERQGHALFHYECFKNGCVLFNSCS
jgi:Xaa-Pro dipeptidase